MLKVDSLIGESPEEAERQLRLAGFCDMAFENIDNVGYLSISNAGISCVVSDAAVVTTVHLYSEGRDGFSQFKGEVPSGVGFDMSRSQIKGFFGRTFESGGGGVIPMLGKRAIWDKFVIGEACTIRLEYSEDEDRVILMSFTK